VLSALCSLFSAFLSVLRPVCCVLCAVCCVLCAVCCVLCAVCCVLCAVCCALCAVRYLHTFPLSDAGEGCCSPWLLTAHSVYVLCMSCVFSSFEGRVFVLALSVWSPIAVSFVACESEGGHQPTRCRWCVHGMRLATSDGDDGDSGGDPEDEEAMLQQAVDEARCVLAGGCHRARRVCCGGGVRTAA
jgi:hypothetical protein